MNGRRTFLKLVLTEFVLSLECFLQLKNLERKVVPVIDSASSFPNEKDLHHGKVKVIFLPRNAPHFVNVWTKVSLEH
jgi:hypothetical protein